MAKIAETRVLVVDDMASIRALVKASLADMGFTQIDEEGNGKQGLDKLETGRYGLVICDWDMPGLTGIEVLRAVRENEKIADLPFVMLTGMSDSATVKEVIEARVSDYVVKPFSPEILQGKIKRLFPG